MWATVVVTAVETEYTATHYLEPIMKENIERNKISVAGDINK